MNKYEKNYGDDVMIPVGDKRLMAFLKIPPRALGMVLFAHGSGSSRLSSRNNFVARKLNEAGFGTLLLDLLEEDEAQDRHNVFDISLLVGRLIAAHGWISDNPKTKDLSVGYFGAS